MINHLPSLFQMVDLLTFFMAILLALFSLCIHLVVMAVRIVEVGLVLSSNRTVCSVMGPVVKCLAACLHFVQGCSITQSFWAAVDNFAC
jgi:hypothetical protein